MKINIINIAKVYCIDFKPAWNLIFKKYSSKKLFKSEIKEGVYNDWWHNDSYIGTSEEFLIKYPHYIVKDEQVYEKPRLILKLNDGSTCTIHYETLEKAHNKEKEITSQSDGWLDI